MDNGYICFYRGKSVEVTAETTLKARDIAVKMFKAKKPWDVTAILAKKNVVEVSHSTSAI